MNKKILSVLLCLFLTGCSGADKAISISLGESVQMQENPEDDVAVNADGDGQVTESTVPSAEELVQLYIYVCGAVKEPGVVVLPEGSRCADALEAVGGFAEGAATEAVNLARLVSDGEQIYFPTVEEWEMAASVLQEEAAGLVNINTADVELLCTLPGIGEAKAKSIVAYREENGSFKEMEDIMQVPGIKENAYSQIRDMITVQ